MRREELFMDILGGLDEKYVSMAMPRSCGHSTVGDTGNVIEIKPVEVSPEVSKKDMRIYWITRTLGMAAAAVFIIGAAVLLIMNWDKIAVRGPDTPPVVTTDNTTMTEPTITFTDSTTADEDPATPDTDNFSSFTAADEWEKEQRRQAFYYPYFAINTIPDNLIALADPNELEKWELMSVDITTTPPESITDYANICTFIAHFGISPENAKKALGDEYREYIGRMWQNSEEADRVIDIICSGDLDDNGNVGELINNTTWGFGGKLICPNWLYVHSLEEWKAAGVKAATVSTMYDYYINNDVLNEEQTAEFKEKIDQYIAENKQGEVSEYVYDEDGDVIPIEAPDAPPDDDDVKPTDEEVQPTDDELKDLVEQGAEACGLTVTVSKLTRGSLQLDYKLDENAPFAGIWYLEWYDHYEIQVQNASGEWETYDPEGYEEFFSNGTIFDGIHELGTLYDEFRGEEKQTVLFYGNYVFGDMYESELPNGKYRVMKKLAAYSTATGENIGTLTVCPEFEINDLTQNIFDIVLSVSNVSPEGVTVEAEQDGRDFLYMKNTIGYRPAFTLQRYENERWVGVPTKDGGIPSWNDAIYPVTVGGKIEINRDFSNIYGSLTDGRYRISTTFVNYYVEPSGVTSILNESVYYIEFPVGDYTYNKFGIWLEVEDVSAEGMTLVITQRGGSYTGELEYGEPYSIERKNGDKWEALEYLSGGTWNDLAYIVEANSDREEKLDWRWLYGTLPAGTYRIAKEFTDYRAPGDSDTQMYYAAFRITEDMASKLGIALRASKYNARNMTLQIVQVGDTGYENIGTNPYRYTIERKTDGIWQSYYAPQAGVPTPDLGLKVKNSGVTEYKLDWSEAAGSLPVGDYRLGMTFSCGDITETRYCEFTVVESMTNEFGISINVLETSKTGVKLGIDSRGADMSGRAYYDKDLYTIEKKGSGGKWKNVVSAASGEMHTGMISLCESGYAGQVDTINWSGWCGELVPGNYRILLKFYTGSGDSYKEITLYAEFDINADTPETLSD